MGCHHDKKTKAQKEGPTPPRGVKETNVKTQKRKSSIKYPSLQINQGLGFLFFFFMRGGENREHAF